MNQLILTAISMLVTTTVFAQNNVSITQNGGVGNTASLTQSGEGNSVSISQTGDATTDGPKRGNRVSLRVPRGTQTTISQHHVGTNSVEISQEGQATATITQSSQTGENAIHTLPVLPDHRGKTQPSKRRNQQ